MVADLQQTLLCCGCPVLMASDKPPKGDLRFLRDWLGRLDGSDFFLEGVEAEPSIPEYSADLVSLLERPDHEPSAQYTSEKIVPSPCWAFQKA